MNLIILLIIGIILYLIFFCNTVEKLEDLEDLSKHSNVNESTKCCKVEKVVLPNNTFGYEYNIKEKCSRDYNSNARYIFENETIDNKPFTLDKCNSSSNLFGSCRKIGFECIDFVTPEDCNKYKLKWSEKTCHSKLPVVIVYPDYTLTSDLKTIVR